ncbi:M15 family metallopeptidase [Allonocardiopsis opalescens]|uniref:D-alanyl-D-alanine carboxypeptidase-like protein n=1 Tax=Allonocardiopsis opalescens TaxID=1144618 RepID=A0A2T0Q066_9ACTN|nr:M15 family metallopeptidase [Allonocardiopsis opalescens]PRX97192.1 D-alanyl-D-alanine carboxypeptidase-like protein [Allonocardiopsis opalescens]
MGRAAAAVLVGGAVLMPAYAWAEPPSESEIAQSRREARERAEDVGAVRAELARVRARLDRLQEEAQQALAAYGRERTELERAQREQESAQERAEQAARRLEESRSEVARYAVAAYKGADLGLVSALAGGPQAALDRAATLDHLSGRRSDQMDRLTAVDVVAETLHGMAEDAREEQERAAAEAGRAAEAAEDAVARQEHEVGEVAAEQTRLEALLADSRRDTEELERERQEALAQAEQAAQAAHADAAGPAEPAGDGGGPVVAEGCHDRPTGLGGYANGQIPTSVLCPLPQAGEYLRADAAAAFIRLDGAFRERFGRPICVTDSYRPYAEQQHLYAVMPPGMAAAPGTSTHGLGVAVDLCGGIERLGTPEHAWMLATAPSFGWDNPPWARGGFEPWHWEYG